MPSETGDTKAVSERTKSIIFFLIVILVGLLGRFYRPDQPCVDGPYRWHWSPK